MYNMHLVLCTDVCKPRFVTLYSFPCCFGLAEVAARPDMWHPDPFLRPSAAQCVVRLESMQEPGWSLGMRLSALVGLKTGPRGFSKGFK